MTSQTFLWNQASSSRLQCLLSLLESQVEKRPASLLPSHAHWQRRPCLHWLSSLQWQRPARSFQCCSPPRGSRILCGAERHPSACTPDSSQTASPASTPILLLLFLKKEKRGEYKRWWCEKLHSMKLTKSAGSQHKMEKLQSWENCFSSHVTHFGFQTCPSGQDVD